MGLFDDDYSFDDLLDDLDFSYPVGTDTSGDISVDDSGLSSVFDIYDTAGAGSLDDLIQEEIYGGSGSFLDMIPSYDFDDYSDYSWMDDLIQEGDTYSADDITGMTDEELAAAIAASDESLAGGDGPLGFGILPGIRNIFLGQGSGPLGGNVLGGGGLLGQILGFGGQGGGQGGGIRSLFGLGGDGGGGFGGSPLLSFLAMKSLLKDEPQGSVPIGGEAYGGQAFNYQDYQPTNLQPALMPGVAYANMAAPAMMVGGEAKQYPNKGLAALAKEAPEVVERMGYEHGGSVENRPGDITFAKLEPGEFVIQKPAVDAIGIETLRKINSMGDGRPYYG